MAISLRSSSLLHQAVNVTVALLALDSLIITVGLIHSYRLWYIQKKLTWPLAPLLNILTISIVRAGEVVASCG